MDPGHTLSAGKLVDEESGLEVVGAVDDQVDSGQQFAAVRGREVGHDRLDRGRRVDALEVLPGGHRLGQSGRHVGFVEEHLPRQIARLGKVAVDEPQKSHTRPHEGQRHDAAERPAADDRHPRGGKPCLAGRAEGGETHLSRITFGIEGLHGAHRTIRVSPSPRP